MSDRGRPVMLPEARSLKMLNQSEYILLVNKYLHMDIEELEEAYNDRYLSSLDHIVIRVILKAIKDADVDRLEALLQRVIGKSYIKPKLIEIKEPEQEKVSQPSTFKIEVVDSGVKIT